MNALLATIFCLVLTGAAAPQAVVEPETHRAVPGAPAPAAKIADLGWLAGAWKGEGIDGAPAYEFWSPPIGDQIVGHFVQSNAEGVRFSELLSIAQKDGSLELRLKHFNADMSAWEEKDEIVRFPLVAVRAGRLVFRRADDPQGWSRRPHRRGGCRACGQSEGAGVPVPAHPVRHSVEPLRRGCILPPLPVLASPNELL